MAELTDRDLNVLVAEKVMGWHFEEEPSCECERVHCTTTEYEDGIKHWLTVWDAESGETFSWTPATDIRDAWEVFTHEGRGGQINRRARGGGWIVLIEGQDDDPDFGSDLHCADDESICRAICKAALRARGVEIE